MAEETKKYGLDKRWLTFYGDPDRGYEYFKAFTSFTNKKAREHGLIDDKNE